MFSLSELHFTTIFCGDLSGQKINTQIKDLWFIWNLLGFGGSRMAQLDYWLTAVCKTQWMQEVLSSPYLSRLAHGPTYPLCNGKGGLFPGHDVAECGIDRPPLSCAKVKNEWWYTSVSVMACYGLMFTFTWLQWWNMHVVTFRHFCKIAKSSC